MNQIEADVLVIGAGITGSTVARELSRYDVETIVVEKGMDVGIQGQTKASGGMLYSGLVMLMSYILKSFVAPDAPIYDPKSQKVRWLEQGFDQARHAQCGGTTDLRAPQVPELPVPAAHALHKGDSIRLAAVGGPGR